MKTPGLLLSTARKQALPYLLFTLALLQAISVTVHAQDPETLIQRMVDEVNLDSLTNYMRVLTGVDSVSVNGERYLIETRKAYTNGNYLASLFLKDRISHYMPVEEASFQWECLEHRPCDPALNLWGILSAENNHDFDYRTPHYILSAHYDSRSSYGDLAPGADDNASGVAALLEAMRVFTKVLGETGLAALKHPVVFVFWDAEEPGPYCGGSKTYAQQAADSGHNILGVVNADMLGYDDENDGSYSIWGHPDDESFARVFEPLNEMYSIGLGEGVLLLNDLLLDHTAFLEKGYSGVTLHEGIGQISWFGGIINPNYHSSNDVWETLNPGKFHKMVKLVVASIAHLALKEDVLSANDEIQTPDDYYLDQNYPNPFNPATTITYILPQSSEVTLTVYDVLGRQVGMLTSGLQPSGQYEVSFDAAGLPSGTYLYRLQAGNYVAMRRMVVVK